MKRCLIIPSLFDLHSDIPSAVWNDRPSAVTYPEKISRRLQVAAIFVPEKTKNPYTFYRNMLREYLHRETLPVNRLEDAKSVLLSLEGGSAFERDIGRLSSIRNDGISSVSLTWNRDNALAGGALDFGGLTLRGIAAIGLINELSLALDLSHLNVKSAAKAVERANTVLLSHTNSAAVFSHPRNMPDSLLKAVGDKGGIIGINFYPAFLPMGDPFEGILKNIEHMLDLDLEGAIAIGSDFDGADMDERLSSTEDVPALYAFLSKKIGDKRIVDGIFFDNAYRFYKNLFDNQRVM